MTWITDDLRLTDACEPAVEWVGERTPRQAWEECPRGDWLLWWAARCDVNVAAIGYWCAERARQSALRALPPSPERDALAACAPITDRTTARAAAAGAVRAAEWAAAYAAEEAAAGAVRAAEWAAECTDAPMTELAAIADEVRRRVSFEALGMEG